MAVRMRHYITHPAMPHPKRSMPFAFLKIARQREGRFDWLQIDGAYVKLPAGIPEGAGQNDVSIRGSVPA